MAKMPAKTKTLQKGASKVLGASFAKFGVVKAGGVLSVPAVVIPAAANVVVVNPAINTTTFVDDDGGDPIPANQGVTAKLDLTNAVPGTYDIEWWATITLGGVSQRFPVSGRLIITEAPPT